MAVHFGTYNSLLDYGLNYIHKKIPAPNPKTVTIDIPLRNGVLDLTNRLTGGTPVFGNRKLEFDFEMRGLRSTWIKQWSTIAENLHGKTMQVELDEDAGWYWEGLVTVDGLEDHGASAGVHITVDAFPFKWSTGLIEIGTYTLSGATTETFSISYPVALPVITVAGTTQITYNDEIFVASPLIKSPPGLYLKTGNSQSIVFDGTGACKFEYRGGIL